MAVMYVLYHIGIALLNFTFKMINYIILVIIMITVEVSAAQSKCCIGRTQRIYYSKFISIEIMILICMFTTP